MFVNYIYFCNINFSRSLLYDIRVFTPRVFTVCRKVWRGRRQWILIYGPTSSTIQTKNDIEKVGREKNVLKTMMIDFIFNIYLWLIFVACPCSDYTSSHKEYSVRYVSVCVFLKVNSDQNPWKIPYGEVRC